MLCDFWRQHDMPAPREVGNAQCQERQSLSATRGRRKAGITCIRRCHHSISQSTGCCCVPCCDDPFSSMMRACLYGIWRNKPRVSMQGLAIMHQQVGATCTDSSHTQHMLLSGGASRVALMRLRSPACQCFVRSISNPQHDKGAAPELRMRRAPDGDA